MDKLLHIEEQFKESLLNEIDRVRLDPQQQPLYESLVERAVNRNIYPVTPYMKERNRTPLQMVDSYGARWHEWEEPVQCPHCGMDFRNHESGPPFRLLTLRKGLDCPDRWHCPSCEKEWPLFGQEY